MQSDPLGTMRLLVEDLTQRAHPDMATVAAPFSVVAVCTQLLRLSIDGQLHVVCWCLPCP
jgi:hypothetical protein